VFLSFNFYLDNSTIYFSICLKIKILLSLIKKNL